MRLRILVTVGGVVLTGCTTTQVRPVGFVPISRASIEVFSALVPASSSAPRCEQVAASPTDPERPAVSLVYAEPTARRVTLTFDPTGAPTFYVDVRGDLDATNERGGERTTIGLYLQEGYAVLSNRASSGQVSFVEVPLELALASDRLDNPGALMERMLAECGMPI